MFTAYSFMASRDRSGPGARGRARPWWLTAALLALAMLCSSGVHIGPGFAFVVGGLFAQKPGIERESEPGSVPKVEQEVPSEARSGSRQESAQELYERMQTRREFLTWHQWAGLGAWALWLATNLSGEQALRGLRRKNDPAIQYLLLTSQNNPTLNLTLASVLRDNSKWESSGADTHIGLAMATFAIYGLSAGLAYFSPPRFEEAERGEFDSIFLHKSLAFVHLAAMLALPFIAGRAEERGPSGAQLMRTVGWAGFGTLSVSVAVFYF